ncbi:MAG TPA: cytochrome P450 [Virgibacillus sp.]|nr:cytochrome P450 [Virgibacillus sp.]
MSNTQQMPQEEGIDNSLNLLREGYMYISNRCDGFNSTVFQTRLLGNKAICMTGKDAATIFYDTEKFIRKDAAPNRAIQTLFGKHSVQTLDGLEHQHRKKMLLLETIDPQKLQELTQIVTSEWENAVEQWIQMDEVILYESSREIMCRTACKWVGVPYEEKNIKQLTTDLTAMFESAGAVGPTHWRGRNARNRIEKWLCTLIDHVRAGEVNLSDDSIFHNFSFYRDLAGQLLDPETIAVEVINLLRPIVAVSIYINFMALALHHYPEESEKITKVDDDYTKWFVQEVRRFYPFFPFTIAQVKQSFTWKGYPFEAGTITLLDLYGTNHDSDIWKNPGLFVPERFMNWEENPYSFIPQGGGDYLLGHRCAGEWVTIEIMKVSLHFLANRITYHIPDQDLSFSLVNMPSKPRSNIIMQNIQHKTSPT